MNKLFELFERLFLSGPASIEVTEVRRAVQAARNEWLERETRIKHLEQAVESMLKREERSK